LSLLPRIIEEWEDLGDMRYVKGYFPFRQQERERKHGKMLSTWLLLSLCSWLKCKKENELENN
jgi:hypothetical protein